MLSMAYVGMDVHQDTTRIAVYPAQGKVPLDACTLPTEETALVKYLSRWASRYQLQCYYEASSGGYVVYRWLDRAGIACQVIAPSKTPRAPGERVKTDTRDASMLAVQGRTGALAVVAAPTPEQEAVRALVRCREARQRDLQVARQRVLKFLGVRGLRFTQTKHWTQAHRRWLHRVTFTGPDAWTWQDYLTDVDYREQRVTEATRQVELLAQTPPYQALVGALCCFRGISTLTAMILIAETLDFHRFGEAPAYMHYLGLTCAEYSSGSRQCRGQITKTGNGRCRRALVEAAWHARFAPAVGERLRARQVGQPAAIIAHAWKAQKRLHATFWRVSQGGKETRRAAVACARELAGFVWAAAQML